MHTFIHRPIETTREMSTIVGVNGILYFLVYDAPLDSSIEVDIANRIDPHPFERLIKFHKDESGDLFSHTAKPVEFPALGLWYNGIKGTLWAEQMKREPSEIEDMAKMAREWRRQRLSFV
jgi:hypothetical protein